MPVPCLPSLRIGSSPRVEHRRQCASHAHSNGREGTSIVIYANVFARCLLQTKDINEYFSKIVYPTMLLPTKSTEELGVIAVVQARHVIFKVWDI